MLVSLSPEITNPRVNGSTLVYEDSGVTKTTLIRGAEVSRPDLPPSGYEAAAAQIAGNALPICIGGICFAASLKTYQQIAATSLRRLSEVNQQTVLQRASTAASRTVRALKSCCGG